MDYLQAFIPIILIYAIPGYLFTRKFLPKADRLETIALSAVIGIFTVPTIVFSLATFFDTWMTPGFYYGCSIFMILALLPWNNIWKRLHSKNDTDHGPDRIDLMNKRAPFHCRASDIFSTVFILLLVCVTAVVYWNAFDRYNFENTSGYLEGPAKMMIYPGAMIEDIFAPEGGVKYYENILPVPRNIRRCYMQHSHFCGSDKAKGGASVLSAMMITFGDSSRENELPVKLLSTLTAILTCMFAYLAVKRLTHNIFPSILASLIITFNLFVIKYSTYIIKHMGLMLFLAIFLVIMIKRREERPSVTDIGNHLMTIVYLATIYSTMVVIRHEYFLTALGLGIYLFIDLERWTGIKWFGWKDGWKILVKEGLKIVGIFAIVGFIITFSVMVFHYHESGNPFVNEVRIGNIDWESCDWTSQHHIGFKGQCFGGLANYPFYDKIVRTPYIQYPVLFFLPLITIKSFGVIIVSFSIFWFLRTWKKEKQLNLFLLLHAMIYMILLGIMENWAGNKTAVMMPIFGTLAVSAACGVWELVRNLHWHRFRKTLRMIVLLLVIIVGTTATGVVMSDGEFEKDDRLYARQHMEPLDWSDYITNTTPEWKQITLLPETDLNTYRHITPQ